MNTNEARAYIKAHATDYLTEAKNGTFICPICGSGAGKNGTGIQRTKDGEHFTCFANNCFTNSDIIDIIGIQHGISTDNAHFIERLQKACEAFNVTLDELNTSEPRERTQAADKSEPEPESENPQTDYTAYYKKCNSNLNMSDYWADRGIGAETCKRFLLGFDNSIYFNSTIGEQPAVIIPISKYKYKVRCTTSKEYRNMPSGASMELFNAKAINDNNVIYITESEINALSLEELGAPAIAIRGTSNTELLHNLVKARKDNITLLLCLDIDEAGDNATNKIIDFAKEFNNIECYDLRPLFSGYELPEGKPINDINEMLVFYRKKLRELVSLSVDDVRERLRELQAQKYIEKYSASARINDFINGISESANTPPTATGFSNLDDYLQGGLREGLYTVGAISSLGKTAYILQVANYIAKSGHDVIIFALEMSETELIGRSISRCTFEYCKEKGINVNPFAKSTINIIDGSKWAKYSDEERHVIKRATQIFAEYSKHLYIVENNGQTSIKDVENIVKRHYTVTGKRPVVIVDYLQLLAPPQERLTDKQAVDITTVRLKKISRDYKTPVIAVSSFNRANYSTKASLESFKESGSIEYTSNITLGFQLKGVGQKGFDVNEAKKKNPREIEIVVLKNRDGKTGDKLYYNYYPQFNVFLEAEQYE